MWMGKECTFLKYTSSFGQWSWRGAEGEGVIDFYQMKIYKKVKSF